MANYTAATSDKSKSKALKLLCSGLGLHLFYVGRVKAGVVRLIIGIVEWIVLIAGTYGLFAGLGVSVFLTGLGLLIVTNIIDAANLILGTFRDNVGAPLREN